MCIEDLPVDDKIVVSSGLYLYQCKPVLDKCRSQITVSDHGYVILYGDKKITVCSGDEDCSISLNVKMGDRYIHKLGGDEIIESYITTHEIDPRLVAGMITCLLVKGYDLVEAFNKVLKLIVSGEGDPYVYIDRVLSEHEYIHRLFKGLDHLASDHEILKMIGSDKILLGCKPHDHRIYVVSIYGSWDNPLIDRVRFYDIDEYCEYRLLPKSCFICLEDISEDKRKNIEELGYKIVDIGILNCIVGEDLINLLLLIKKIYS